MHRTAPQWRTVRPKMLIVRRWRYPALKYVHVLNWKKKNTYTHIYSQNKVKNHDKLKKKSFSWEEKTRQKFRKQTKNVIIPRKLKRHSKLKAQLYQQKLPPTEISALSEGKPGSFQCLNFNFKFGNIYIGEKQLGRWNNKSQTVINCGKKRNSSNQRPKEKVHMLLTGSLFYKND